MLGNCTEPAVSFFQPFSGHGWMWHQQWKNRKVVLLSTTDWNEFDEAIALLRVPALMKQTRILAVNGPRGTKASCSAEKVKQKFGTDLVTIKNEQILEIAKSIDPKAAEAEAEQYWIKPAIGILEPKRQEIIDYRDGTNYTGLNPDGQRYVRHIGITGHQSSPVLMNAIQRDDLNILDTMLVAVNANDRQYQSHQFNAVPAARAKGMGVIAMKLFSAGGIYSGLQRQPQNAAELIRTVGAEGGVASQDLVRYPLSVAGVTTAIVGVSNIDRENPEKDQLTANLASSMMDAASDAERARIESAVASSHGTRTNYFQDNASAILQPAAPKLEPDGERVWVRWNSALAAREAIRSYAIWIDGRRVAWMPYRPQLSTAGLALPIPRSAMGNGNVCVEASTDLPPWQFDPGW